MHAYLVNKSKVAILTFLNSAARGLYYFGNRQTVDKELSHDSVPTKIHVDFSPMSSYVCMFVTPSRCKYCPDLLKFGMDTNSTPDSVPVGLMKNRISRLWNHRQKLVVSIAKANSFYKLFDCVDKKNVDKSKEWDFSITK